MSLSHLYTAYIVPASTLLPIVAGLVWYKKMGKAAHVLIIYLCIAMLINIGGIVIASYNRNNLPLLHFYTMFELAAVMWYYREVFSNKWANRWTTILMIVFPILCFIQSSTTFSYDSGLVINFRLFQSIHEFPTYTRPLEAIIIMVFSGIYLGGSGNFNNGGISGNAGRWVASGFMLYFFSSLFQFIFSSVISHHASKDVKLFIWDLHATFVLIMYIFFFVAIKNERGKR